MNSEDEQPIAWYWAESARCLFVGLSGENYPDSSELTDVVIQGQEEACQVFMHFVNPYAAYLLPPGGNIPLICYKEIHQPPKQLNLCLN